MNDCICCGKNDFSEIRKTSCLLVPVFLCNNCGLSMSGKNELEMSEKLEELYKSDYWSKMKNVGKVIETDYNDLDSAFVRTRIKSQINYCKNYLKPQSKLLEIGCGFGINIFELEKIGLNVMGVEPDSRNVKLINKRLKNGICHTGFWEEFETDKKFDAIWFSHSLEHFVRPDISLKKASKHLNPNGIIFIEIPNTENDIRLESSITHNPHTFHFTKSSVMKLVESCGFQIISCDLFNRRRNIKEKVIRGLEKYAGLKSKNAPYHFYKTDNVKIANEIRLIIKNKNLL